MLMIKDCKYSHLSPEVPPNAPSDRRFPC